MEVVPLEQLGPRIMICGPTNSGKSTLAHAIGLKRGVPAVHVDLLRHQPHTDWKQRPDEEFHALHAAAIAEPEWVMDGNYSALMPARYARATGVIVLDERLAVRFARYFRRTLWQRARVGALDGCRDSIKWAMIHWLWHTRRSAAILRRKAAQSGLPAVMVGNRRELDALYAAWGLSSATRLARVRSSAASPSRGG